MSNLKSHTAIAIFSTFHKSSIKNLPLNGSIVALDILLALYLSRKLKVKELFHSLPHSYTAVRYHYNRLLLGDWINVEDDLTDRRIKYLLPSEKLVEAFKFFSLDIKEELIYRKFLIGNQETESAS